MFYEITPEKNLFSDLGLSWEAKSSGPNKTVFLDNHLYAILTNPNIDPTYEQRISILDEVFSFESGLYIENAEQFFIFTKANPEVVLPSALTEFIDLEYSSIIKNFIFNNRHHELRRELKNGNKCVVKAADSLSKEFSLSYLFNPDEAIKKFKKHFLFTVANLQELVMEIEFEQEIFYRLKKWFETTLPNKIEKEDEND